MGRRLSHKIIPCPRFTNVAYRTMFHLGFTLFKSLIRLTSYVSAVVVRGATWIELDARIVQNAELGRCWLVVCRAERVLNGSGSTVRNATTNCCARSHTRNQRELGCLANWNGRIKGIT